MTLISQYRAFVAGLAGYTEISFDKFRNTILPLKVKKEWSAAQTGLVQMYADAGASYSLQQLFGIKHPAASLVLGAEAVKPEPVNAVDLHARMERFGEACRLRDASPLWYIAALATLHSTEYKLNLQDADKKFPGLSGFADEYRAASHNYKKIVDGHFLALAGSFVLMSATWFPPLMEALEYKTPPVILDSKKYPWSKKFLKLGRLGGSQFVQTLKDCVCKAEVVYLAAELARTSRNEKAKEHSDSVTGHDDSEAKKTANKTKKNARKRVQRAKAASSCLTCSDPDSDLASDSKREVETPAPLEVTELPEWAQRICSLLENTQQN